MTSDDVISHVDQHIHHDDDSIDPDDDPDDDPENEDEAPPSIPHDVTANPLLDDVTNTSFLPDDDVITSDPGDDVTSDPGDDVTEDDDDDDGDFDVISIPPPPGIKSLIQLPFITLNF